MEVSNFDIKNCKSIDNILDNTAKLSCTGLKWFFITGWFHDLLLTTQYSENFGKFIIVLYCGGLIKEVGVINLFYQNKKKKSKK